MRFTTILLVSLFVGLCWAQRADEEDDFAEFDFADDDAGAQPKQDPADGKSPPVEDDFDDEDEDEFINEPNQDSKDSFADDDDEAVVEDVDSEFNHFADDEEFVGYNVDGEDEEDEFEHMSTKGRGAKEKRKSQTPPPPKTIKITNIPAHLRTNWENYYLEMLMVAGIVVYFLNFFAGKTKNQRIANAWFNSNKSMLESNFSLVGDDGSKNVDEIETQIVKESENLFTLWCSGRVCCEGMLVELKLLKRQDLVAVISNLMKPAHDQVYR